MPDIYGEKVRLRAVQREDLDNFMGWVNDPEVGEHISFVFPMSRAEEEQWIERVVSGDDHNSQVLVVQIFDGTYLGNIGLHQIDQRVGRATLGIVIGKKEEWGKGYGTDALCALLDFSFNTLNLQKVDLMVKENNERAIHLYRKCGFNEVGRLPRHEYRGGKYIDMLWMSVLREDFQEIKHTN